jgi:hypothetical protein
MNISGLHGGVVWCVEKYTCQQEVRCSCGLSTMRAAQCHGMIPWLKEEDDQVTLVGQPVVRLRCACVHTCRDEQANEAACPNTVTAAQQVVFQLMLHRILLRANNSSPLAALCCCTAAGVLCTSLILPTSSLVKQTAMCGSGAQQTAAQDSVCRTLGAAAAATVLTTADASVHHAQIAPRNDQPTLQAAAVVTIV